MEGFGNQREQESGSSIIVFGTQTWIQLLVSGWRRNHWMAVIWVRKDQIRVVLKTWVGFPSQSAFRILVPGKIRCHGCSAPYDIGLWVTRLYVISVLCDLKIDLFKVTVLYSDCKLIKECSYQIHSCLEFFYVHWKNLKEWIISIEWIISMNNLKWS